MLRILVACIGFTTSFAVRQQIQATADLNSSSGCFFGCCKTSKCDGPQKSTKGADIRLFDCTSHSGKWSKEYDGKTFSTPADIPASFNLNDGTYLCKETCHAEIGGKIIYDVDNNWKQRYDEKGNKLLKSMDFIRAGGAEGSVSYGNLE